MQNEIIYSPEVRIYLRELIQILYDKNYFGFYESAAAYVSTLRLKISESLPISLRKSAPPYFPRYGKDLWYISVRMNDRTTWYVFFTNPIEEIYLIHYITNNHVAAQYL